MDVTYDAMSILHADAILKFINFMAGFAFRTLSAKTSLRESNVL